MSLKPRIIRRKRELPITERVLSVSKKQHVIKQTTIIPFIHYKIVTNRAQIGILTKISERPTALSCVLHPCSSLYRERLVQGAHRLSRAAAPPQKKHLVVPDPDAADSCLQKKTPWCTIGLLDALTRRPTTAYDSRANGVHESADKHVMRWDRCGALNALGCLGRWWAVMGSNHRPTG